MRIPLVLAVLLATVKAEDDFEPEARLGETIKPAYPFVTLVGKTTVTSVLEVTPSCYEPAETLSLCSRKKRQLALLLDPFGYGSQAPLPIQYYQPLDNPVIHDPVDVEYGIAGRTNSKKAVPALDPSFKSADYNKLPPEFLQIFGGFFTSEVGPATTVFSTVTASTTQTLPLDCLVLGSSIPANLCDISMIFPLPPASVELTEYCLAVARLAGVGYDACVLTPLVDGTGVYIRFTKLEAEVDQRISIVNGVFPSRKLIIKNLLISLTKHCNIFAGGCSLPGFPDGYKLNIFKIFIPGVQNIRNFITQILIEVTGGGASLCDNNHILPVENALAAKLSPTPSKKNKPKDLAQKIE